MAVGASSIDGSAPRKVVLGIRFGSGDARLEAEFLGRSVQPASVLVIAADVDTADVEDGWYLRARVLSKRLPGGVYDLEYRVSGAVRKGDTAIGDALVAALLLPAMALGEELHIGSNVSARLLSRVPDIAAIYRAWTFGVSGTVVTAPSATPTTTGQGDALFFSGGADSFYSFLKHRPLGRLSRLVFINGFDIPLGNASLGPAMESVERVAAASGATTVTISTNLRSLSESIVGWGAYHGAVLASAGQLLGGDVSRCLIPASRAYQYLTPWGSHPALDPLWSTEVLEYIHDGAEALRHEKLRLVAEDPLGQREMRVCLQAMNGRDVYNCGRCEKCLVSMLALQLQGLLTRATTFPALDLGLVDTLSPQAIGTLRDLASRPGADRATVQALERVRRVRRRTMLITDVVNRARAVVSPKPSMPPVSRVARTRWQARMIPLLDDTSDSYAPSNVFLQRPESFYPSQ
jgi:hypothetical protein